jgi:hypothetical protein
VIAGVIAGEIAGGIALENHEEKDEQDSPPSSAGR